MRAGEERCLVLANTREEAWEELERYRAKLVEHRAERGFGLSVRYQAGSWGVWIKHRRISG